MKKNAAELYIFQVSDYDNRDILEKNLLPLLERDLKSKVFDKVCIKINICDARTPETGVITHPLFLDTVLKLIRYILGYDVPVFVCESDATVVLADDFINWFGYMPILEKWKAEWCNLSKVKTVKKKIDGFYLKEIDYPQIFENSCLITLPKLKTNLLSETTGCLKNQFGCLPIVEKNIFHEHLDETIADVNLVFKPDICIMDGIIGMGGYQGPSFGIPIAAKIVIYGIDPVAVDSLSAKIIGYSPKKVGHIKKAAKLGIGSMNYVVIGNVSKIDFRISKFKTWLFRFGSNMKKISMKKMRLGWEK